MYKSQKMASAIMKMVGGAVVNAVAFSASSFGFSQINNPQAERKRHDLAIEELQRAKNLWNQKRLERLDYINDRMRQEKNAEQRFNELSVAMKQYRKAFGVKLSELPPEPKLSDFYTPSEDQHNSELVFITVSMVGLGAFIYYKF